MALRPKFVLTLATLFVLGVSSTQAGPIVFDNFTSPGPGGQAIVQSPPAGNPSAFFSNSNNAVATGLLFGTQREITTQRFAGSGIINTNVNTTVPGSWSVGNDTATGSIASSRYNFASQGFSLDFSGTGTIDLTGLFLDAGQVDFTVELIGGAGTWTSGPQSISGNVVNGSLSFALLASAGILNSVDELRIIANSSIAGPNGVAGSDFSIGAVSIPDDTVVVNEIPEPASMAVFGLVTLAGGVIARRRMAKA